MQWVTLGPPESDQFAASNFEEMQPLSQVSQQPIRSSPRKQRGIVVLQILHQFLFAYFFYFIEF